MLMGRLSDDNGWSREAVQRAAKHPDGCFIAAARDVEGKGVERRRVWPTGKSLVSTGGRVSSSAVGQGRTHCGQACCLCGLLGLCSAPTAFTGVGADVSRRICPGLSSILLWATLAAVRSTASFTCGHSVCVCAGSCPGRGHLTRQTGVGLACSVHVGMLPSTCCQPVAVVHPVVLFLLTSVHMPSVACGLGM
jgi:hypothetical protein